MGKETERNESTAEEGSAFLWLALSAFAGLGAELIYAFLLEPLLYGAQIQDWNEWQSILHWSLTGITWGALAWILIRTAGRKYHFHLLQRGEPLKAWQWAAAAACLLFSLAVSYWDWQGFKIVQEFRYNGWLKFLFQYLYYLFETGLFTLILVFAQKACEIRFRRKRIPYGGIIVALTWGLGHILTKGSLAAGVLSGLSGLLFGVVYLVVNRDLRKAFPLIFLMFVL